MFICMFVTNSHACSRFWKVLLQETHLSLDKGFLLSLHDMYSRYTQVPDEVSCYLFKIMTLLVRFGYLNSCNLLNKPFQILQATRLKEDLKIIQAPLYEQMVRAFFYNCLKPKIKAHPYVAIFRALVCYQIN